MIIKLFPEAGRRAEEVHELLGHDVEEGDPAEEGEEADQLGTARHEAAELGYRNGQL